MPQLRPYTEMTFVLSIPVLAMTKNKKINYKARVVLMCSGAAVTQRQCRGVLCAAAVSDCCSLLCWEYSRLFA